MSQRLSGAPLRGARGIRDEGGPMPSPMARPVKPEGHGSWRMPGHEQRAAVPGRTSHASRIGSGADSAVKPEGHGRDKAG